MRPKTTCSFTRQYSAIEGLQQRRTITYAAKTTADGIYLLLKQESDRDSRTEACICPFATMDTAAAFLRYMCENGVDIGCWFDVLRDLRIPFTVANPPVPAA